MGEWRHRCASHLLGAIRLSAPIPSSCSSFSHRKKGTGREEHFGRPLARTKCSSRKWCPDQAHKKGKDIEPDPKHHFLLFLFLSKVKRKREEIVTGALLAPVNDLFGRSL